MSERGRIRSESDLVEALNDWGREPMAAPDDAGAAARRDAVANMARMIRIGHERRTLRRRRWLVALVAAAVVVAISGTALAWRAMRGGEEPRGRLGDELERGRAIAVALAGDRAVVPSRARPDADTTTSPIVLPSAEAVTASAPPSVAAKPPIKPAPPASRLAEQNRIFSAALAAKRAGNDADTVRLCDELVGRFPDSPLADQARAERAAAAARLAHARGDR